MFVCFSTFFLLLLLLITKTTMTTVDRRRRVEREVMMIRTVGDTGPSWSKVVPGPTWAFRPRITRGTDKH